MKKRILLILLTLSTLLSLAGCGKEPHNLLREIECGGRIYCVRGSSMRAKRIVVKENDEVIWSERVKVDSSVGTQNGTYGFDVLDLNFDGFVDFLIADDVAGDCISYKCWLWDSTEGDYVLSEDLTGLCNVRIDVKMEALFAFAHTYETEKEYADVPATTTTSDSTTKYIWQDGALIPQIRASITYFSETNLYLYSVAYYNEETKSLEADYTKEQWLTPEEYKTHDMSFLYYFKN